MKKGQIKTNLINKALNLHQRNELEGAEELYLQILEQNPCELNALNLLGVLKSSTKQFNEAIFHLKKATEVNSNFFEAWFNLANAYKNNEQLDESIYAYQKAAILNPQAPQTYFNLANIFESQNKTEKALEYYKKAKEYGVKEPKIDYFIGISELKLKNFKDGWTGHETRPGRDLAIYTQAIIYPKITPENEWHGEDIKDKTLFVYYDSGLGDTIMYLRYLPLLKDKCKKVIFKPQNGFTELLSENDFGVEIVNLKTLPQDVDFDFHISLMSLPYVLQLNEEKDIPYPQGYLKANPQKVIKFKNEFFNNDKFKIGIKWKGNTIYDQTRIIPISAFNEILNFPNTQFYSLQKGEGEGEINGLKTAIITLGETFNDFSDTAAAIENMDLVICNDTSIAHLAGALNKTCWIALPFVQNWRWHNDLSYSPWYKSVRLFKQNSPENWGEVFEKIKQELINTIK